MKKRRIKIAILIIVLIVAVSLVFGWRIQIPRALGYRGAVITMRRTMCFGTCPDYKVTIYGDGRVVYEGYNYVGVKGTRTSQIPPEEVRDLVNEMTGKGYFFLFSIYYRMVTDNPTYFTSLSINGFRKSVMNYAGPVWLSEFEDRIDEVADTDRWVKGWEGEAFLTIPGTEYDYVSDAAYAPDGSILITGGFAGTIRRDPSYNSALPCEINTEPSTFLIKLEYLETQRLRWWETPGTLFPDYAVCVDDESNVYIAGNFRDRFPFGAHNPETIIEPVDEYNIAIIKFNRDLEYTWSTVKGHSDSIRLEGMDLDGEGNIYIGATIHSESAPGQEPTFSDWLIFKLDPDGNQEWERLFAGTRHDLLNDLVCDDSGNCYVCGFFSSGTGMIPVLSGNPPPIDEPGAMLIKLTSDGDVEWLCKWAGAFADAVALDESGNVYVGGDFNDSVAWQGLPSEMHVNETDGMAMFLSSVDNEGLHRWTTTFGGGNNLDLLNSIAVYEDSYVLVTGRHVEGNPCDAYLYVIRTDGEEGFMHVIGGFQGQVVKISDAGIIFIGGTFMNSPIGLDCSGENHVVAGELDAFFLFTTMDELLSRISSE